MQAFESELAFRSTTILHTQYCIHWLSKRRKWASNAWNANKLQIKWESVLIPFVNFRKENSVKAWSFCALVNLKGNAYKTSLRVQMFTFIQTIARKLIWYFENLINVTRSHGSFYADSHLVHGLPRWNTEMDYLKMRNSDPKKKFFFFIKSVGKNSKTGVRRANCSLGLYEPGQTSTTSWTSTNAAWKILKLEPTTSNMSQHSHYMLTYEATAPTGLTGTYAS